MENYLLMFIIDINDPKGKELANIKDLIPYRNEMVIQTFSTRRKLRDFLDEYSSGMLSWKQYKQL